MSATCTCGHYPWEHHYDECDNRDCGCTEYRDSEAEQLRVKLAAAEKRIEEMAGRLRYCVTSHGRCFVCGHDMCKGAR